VVVPFGLENAPATFMCLVNGVFRDYMDNFFIVFLNDILVYSKTKEEHEQYLRMVLHVLRENQLYSKLRKCKEDTLFGSHCFRRWHKNGSKKY
jgi:hypothetical protein